MRAKEIIMEVGLSKLHMSKHAGVYLNNLIKLIQNQTPIELSSDNSEDGALSKQTVSIEPSEADRLAGLFYRDSDPNNVEVNNADSIVPPKSIHTSDQYLETVDGDKIPWGNIDKGQAKGAAKTYNAGDVAEALLGASVTARIVKLGEKINEDDVIKILSHSSDTAQKTGNKGTNISTSVEYDLNFDDYTDKIMFNVNLSGRSYIPLLKMATGETEFAPDVKAILGSSVKFANSRASQGVDRVLEVISGNDRFDKIVISSDGLGDQKGTKADLFVSINDKPVNLLSLKAGSVKQFGQNSGQGGEDVSNFFETMFGIKLPAKAIDKIDSLTGKENVKERGAFLKNEVYPALYKKLKTQLSTNAGETDFVRSVYRGILHHATLGNSDVELLIVGNKPNAPEFKLLRFGEELREKLEGINLDVTLPSSRSPTSVTLKIGAKSVSDPAIKNEPAGNYELLQLRSTAKTEGVVRNIIEMGGLLKKLAAVEYEEGEEQEELP